MAKFITATILLLSSVSASAIPVTWKLNNVMFDDGRYAVGTFTYDADTNVYSDSNVRLIPSLDPGFPTIFNIEGHVNSQVPVDNTAESTIFTYSFFPGFDGILVVHFEDALANNGDEVTIDLNKSTFPGIPYPLAAGHYTVYADGVYEGVPLYQEGTYSYIVSGTVSVVPLPAAVWLFGSALAGVGWLRRKQVV